MHSLQEQGKKLKTIRKKARLTQEGLAERINCSVRHIQNIEAGRSDPSLKLATKWFQATNISFSFNDFSDEISPLFQ